MSAVECICPPGYTTTMCPSCCALSKAQWDAVQPAAVRERIIAGLLAWADEMCPADDWPDSDTDVFMAAIGSDALRGAASRIRNGDWP